FPLAPPVTSAVRPERRPIAADYRADVECDAASLRRLQILSYPEAEVPVDLRLQVLRLQRETWPSAEPLELGLTHDPALEPLSLLLVDDELRVISALAILSKPLVHRGFIFRASGLSTVVTDEALRGRGHGLELVRHAREVVR